MLTKWSSALTCIVDNPAETICIRPEIPCLPKHILIKAAAQTGGLKHRSHCVLSHPQQFCINIDHGVFDSRLQAPGISFCITECSQTFLTMLWWSGWEQMFLPLSPCLLLTAWETVGEFGEQREVNQSCWTPSAPATPSRPSNSISGWNAISQTVAQTLAQAALAAGSPQFRR